MKWKYKRGRFKGPVCQRCLAHLWRQKGYAAERDLVRRLEKLGYSAIRIPTSAPGQISLPDVAAFHNPEGPALAFEVKAVSAKRWTVYAWKMRRGKKEPSQIVKCFEYLRKMYPPGMEKHVAVAVKFLLGARVKAPWIVCFVEDPGLHPKNKRRPFSATPLTPSFLTRFGKAAQFLFKSGHSHSFI